MTSHPPHPPRPVRTGSSGIPPALSAINPPVPAGGSPVSAGGSPVPVGGSPVPAGGVSVPAGCSLALLRHGRSVWNIENRFTGWVDAPLSPQGADDARRAGRLMREAGCVFDFAACSLLKRAAGTLWRALEEMDLLWLPVVSDWRLNERHYGALQGKNKDAAAKEFGAERVREWRRGYRSRPPLLPESSLSPESPKSGSPESSESSESPESGSGNGSESGKGSTAKAGNGSESGKGSDFPIVSDGRYAGIDLPRGESLADARIRASSFYTDAIIPRLRSGGCPLIVAHGNILRALTMEMSETEDTGETIRALEIPPGVPLLCNLDSNLRITSRKFLGP